MRGGPRANSGGARAGAGRPPDPRLTPAAVAALLRSLVPGDHSPSDYARALGTRPERVREALRDGCTERRAGKWRASLIASCAGSTDVPAGEVGAGAGE